MSYYTTRFPAGLGGTGGVVLGSSGALGGSVLELGGLIWMEKEALCVSGEGAAAAVV